MSKKGRVSKIQLFFKNEMYALLYQLIIVPVLMYVVYQLFMKSLSFSNNGIMEVFYLVILIGVMSGILNALFKMKYDVQCADDTVSTCANAITNMRLSTFILICVIIFYILFLLMHLITRKQKDAE